MTNQKATADVETSAGNDLRYYLSCPLRKNRARIPVTVCQKQRCLFLGSENGKPKCNYGFQPRGGSSPEGFQPRGRSSPEGDPNIISRPKVKKIDRDGVV